MNDYLEVDHGLNCLREAFSNEDNGKRFQETLENICRARMDAIHQLELRYRLTEAQTFTDSLALLKDVVIAVFV